jgi:GDP-4-dehydro-6-deoxy-D-mannose reductase
VPPGRILVTGATGFVGRHLLPELRRRFPEAQVTPTTCNIADRDAVAAQVQSARPDAVVHLAGIAAPVAAGRDPDLAWRVNLHGALNLAHALQQTAPECLLLFVSSGDAYGASFRTGLPVDENAPLAPLNTYSATKAAADLALGAMAAEGLRCIRVRPLNHTGPGQSDAFVVPAFARQVARIAAGLQAPVLEVGSLDPRRDFLDVRDVCAAYATVLERADKLASGLILNLASGVARRIGDVLDALLDAAATRAEIRTDTARMRRSEIALAIGDASLARRTLDWAPSIPWTRTLADVLEDWRGRVRE